MNEVYYLLISGVLALFIEWLISFWLRTSEKQSCIEAKKILSKHGLTPRMYLATIGVEDEELRKALCKYTGYIVLDKNSVVVGK
jgi:hypothetical protein